MWRAAAAVGAGRAFAFRRRLGKHVEYLVRWQASKLATMGRAFPGPPAELAGCLKQALR